MNTKKSSYVALNFSYFLVVRIKLLRENVKINTKRRNFMRKENFKLRIICVLRIGKDDEQCTSTGIMKIKINGLFRTQRFASTVSVSGLDKANRF